MKLNAVLPWVLVLGLGSALGAVYVSSKAKETELATLRQEKEQADAAQAELDEARTERAQLQAAIAGLQGDKQELLRLRSEVVKLRDEKQQLSKQLQSAQTEAQRAQAQATQTAEAAAQQAQQYQTELQQSRHAVMQNQQALAQRGACIHNLRLLDAAKQQWALENQKTADAQPTLQDLAAYLGGNPQPVCPVGGAYALNAVGQQPACAVPGHSLTP